MPRKCSICVHPDREAIDLALVASGNYRELSALYRVSDDALMRHKANHLPAVLAKAQEACEVSRADDLLSQIRNLQRRTLVILDNNTGRDDRVALSAIREARSNIDLLGQLLGRLDNSPKLAILVASPEWVQLRANILLALSPYPDAAHAVLEALDSGNVNE